MKREHKFFIHGRYFYEEEEFWKFVKEWPDMPVDLEDFKNKMNEIIQTIELNVRMNPKFTNQMAYELAIIEFGGNCDNVAST